MSPTTDTKTATIDRLVTPDHACPYDLKSLDLLKREGYEVDDRHLETEEEATAFREKWTVLNRVSVPVALFIGTVGAVSVSKAVWIEKRELKSACVGGSSNVPLRFVSFTENAAMVGMALWMDAARLI